MSKLTTVAHHEFMTNLRRWEFLLVTLGLPLMTVALVLITSVPNYLYLRSKQLEARVLHVGVVDPSHSLTFPKKFEGSNAPAESESSSLKLPKNSKLKTDILTAPSSTWIIEPFADRQEAERALIDKHIEYLYVFDNDYRVNGKVEALFLKRSPFDLTPRPPMAYLIREHFLKGKIDAASMKRVRIPLVETTSVLDEKGLRIADPESAQLVSLFLPYAMMVLLMLGLLGSSTYIVRGLVDEKESRIQEVLLSAVRPSDLFFGKILGLGALGIFQVSVWLLLGLPAAVAMLKIVEVPSSAIVMFFVYFILGYMLYAAIVAGIGAIGSSEKESNQIFAIFAMMIASPMFFLPILLDNPHGWLQRFFSIFPFTSPSMMVLRSVNGGNIPISDLCISLLLLALTVFAAMRLSLKIFKLGLLMYGKTPHPREIWKTLWV